MLTLQIYPETQYRSKTKRHLILQKKIKTTTALK